MVEEEGSSSETRSAWKSHVEIYKFLSQLNKNNLKTEFEGGELYECICCFQSNGFLNKILTTPYELLVQDTRGATEV